MITSVIYTYAHVLHIFRVKVRRLGVSDKVRLVINAHRIAIPINCCVCII